MSKRPNVLVLRTLLSLIRMFCWFCLCVLTRVRQSYCGCGCATASLLFLHLALWTRHLTIPLSGMCRLYPFPSSSHVIPPLMASTIASLSQYRRVMLLCVSWWFCIGFAGCSIPRYPKWPCGLGQQSSGIQSNVQYCVQGIATPERHYLFLEGLLLFLLLYCNHGNCFVCCDVAWHELVICKAWRY